MYTLMVSGIMHSVDKSEDTFVQVHLLKKVIEHGVKIWLMEIDKFNVGSYIIILDTCKFTYYTFRGLLCTSTLQEWRAV